MAISSCSRRDPRVPPAPSGLPWLLALGVLGLLLRPASVHASPEEPEPIAVEVSGGTHFPVSVGADVGIELPARLLLRTHVGWMPPAYLDVINATANALGLYNEITGDLIEAAIEQAFVFRLSGGWRPFENEGFELTAGYTLVIGAGGVTSAEAVQAVTGQSIMPRRSDSNVGVDATLHAIHAAFSWRWLFAEDHLVVRAGIGFVYTLDAVVDMDAEDTVLSERGVQRSETNLEETLETYGFTPELRLTVGYRF